MVGFPSVYSLILDWDKVFGSVQLWRLVTCFLFFGPFSIAWIFQMYILITYFRHLEQGQFGNGARGLAELVFMVVFNASVLLLAAWLLGGLPVLGPALVFSALYVWSRKDPYQMVVLYGFRFTAWHFPFVLLVIGMLLNGGSPPIHDILGILVGHLYFFLDEIVPKRYGVTLLKTPALFYDKFERAAARADGRVAPRPTWMSGQGHRMT